MEDAGWEFESLLGADDTALVPEEKCVCRLEGKEKDRKCYETSQGKISCLDVLMDGCWWEYCSCPST